MNLPIISAEERLKEHHSIKGCIFGKSGIGKTSLLWTLNPAETLFIDLEAGDLAVKEWPGDTLRPKTWSECRDLAVFIGGPNLSLKKEEAYSQDHYRAVCESFGDRKSLEKYKTIFIDSITVAGRLCFRWCKNQPQCFSERTKTLNMLEVYGLHGQEMMGWLTLFQHIRRKNIWFVGILDEKMDEFNGKVYVPQIEGAKTGLELPGIVDEVLVMSEIPVSDGKTDRGFVCQTLNDWGYPAKDRSGKLAVVEKAHLGQLMAKISARKEQKKIKNPIKNSLEMITTSK